MKDKNEDAEIYWSDETGLRSDSQHGRGYAPKGKTPVIRLSAKRTTSNIITAVTNQGKVRFQVYDGSMNAKILIGFMKRLIKDFKRKVILMLDNFRVHHTKVVKAWLAFIVELLRGTTSSSKVRWFHICACCRKSRSGLQSNFSIRKSDMLHKQCIFPQG